MLFLSPLLWVELAIVRQEILISRFLRAAWDFSVARLRILWESQGKKTCLTGLGTTFVSFQSTIIGSQLDYCNSLFYDWTTPLLYLLSSVLRRPIIWAWRHGPYVLFRYDNMYECTVKIRFKADLRGQLTRSFNWRPVNEWVMRVSRRVLNGIKQAIHWILVSMLI